MNQENIPNPENGINPLEAYGINLTDLAKNGKIDPVIGREDEIRRIVQILSRRKKNNPVLIGEPGTGKTTKLLHYVRTFVKLGPPLNKIGYFSQNQFGLYGAISRSYSKWQIGLGIKLLFHTIDDHYGLGAGINIGAHRVFHNTHLGIVLNNSPSSGIIWDNGNIELSPGSLSVGLHHLIRLNKYNLELNPICKTNFLIMDRTIDSKLLFNSIPVEVYVAMETIYKRKIFFRLGRLQSGSLSTGLGLILKNISIDYAFIVDNSIKGLDNNHLITVGVSSDWIKERVFN